MGEARADRHAAPPRWSEVVHESRKTAAIAQARADSRARRRGYPLEVGPTARLPALLAVAGALSGLAAWRREGARLRGGGWRGLPFVRAVAALVDAQRAPRRPSAVRGQVKPRPVAPGPQRRGAAPSAAVWEEEQRQRQQQQQQGAPQKSKKKSKAKKKR
ncbi:hypothetical protein Rsub_04197 [Raphidocelis subcapitata]|uniref:Uncharacterized protein n=1 Tax=Raphidocelis subcapitata TaxID=307507 RepID=A0A2V0P2M7_9CHLO|nr:hypothetical protein Rsub_04197 [Raphidocelis subcapitata]|eukprot:GBF91457.1 hypothetical protein Rsub_04197 [Raphidocelis subcapitata]